MISLLWPIFIISFIRVELSHAIPTPLTGLLLSGNVSRNNMSSVSPPLVRVTRRENGTDSFTTSKIVTCSSISVEFCAKARAAVVEDAKECICQCPPGSPVFQDDMGTCVPQIQESAECRFGALADGNKQEVNPTVRLPPFGHSIGRKVNLTLFEPMSFDRQCLELECHFLTTDGWSSFSSIRLGSQPPRLRLVAAPQLTPPRSPQESTSTKGPESGANSSFLVYNLQWLGSSEHADYLQGRQILVTAICNATGLPPLNFCFPMRVAGMSGRLRSSALMDGAGAGGAHDNDNVETGVLVAAACGGALGVLYVIVLAIFVTSRLRKRRKIAKNNNSRQPSTGDGHENVPTDDVAKSIGALPDADQLRNPQAYHPAAYSQAWSDEFARRNRFIPPRGPTPPSLPLRYMCSPPPFFLNDVLIVQTPDAIHKDTQMQSVIHKRVENKLLPKPPIRRRKVFFDPEYLNAELLKNPPDAAENFRAQIHCMVNITKSRLDRRKFLPHLEMIDEENSLRRSMMGHFLQLPDTASHQSAGQPLHIPEVLEQNLENRPPVSKDLDCVVLQVKPAMPTSSEATASTDSQMPAKNDWSQILKDEWGSWGSNESLAKVPLRRRIQDVFHGHTSESGKKPRHPNRSSPTGEISKKPSDKSKLKAGDGKMSSRKTVSDDEESDKASSKSGTGSSPEKDSGIEDDVNSDKSTKIASHKSKGEVPGMISRKKIVSASAAIGVTSLPTTRGRVGNNAHPPQALPAF